VPVAEVIEDALRSCGLGDHLERVQAISAWPTMVGDKIARHSRAVDLKDGVLVLEADHGAWRQELTLLLPLIKERYNRAFGQGAVREIRWSHRPPRPHRAPRRDGSRSENDNRS
jgi:predicted nucleic acid-binding Zn ribbon protein